MATMVKEARKEKKKSKSKSSKTTTRQVSDASITTSPLSEETFFDSIVSPKSLAPSEYFLACEENEETVNRNIEESNVDEEGSNVCNTSLKDEENKSIDQNVSSPELSLVKEELVDNVDELSPLKNIVNVNKEAELSKTHHIESIDTTYIEEIPSTQELICDEYNIEMPSTSIEVYKELSNKLEKMSTPEQIRDISEERQSELCSPFAYLNIQNVEQESPTVTEEAIPSAPCFEEIPEMSMLYEELVVESKPEVQCMAIEDVMRLYSGGEMEEVRALSDREEELVENGPVSGPEHPLVDLLSTFRSSLTAVERERILLANGFADEEKSRSSLWKIEKRNINLSEKCVCGANVVLKATYEHAELVRERLPVAKMKLEGLLRDVQDSYCHHQHAALLAYYQIEDVISQTITSNKSVIREALSLVLVALRLSAGAPDALAAALERWALALADALVDQRDLRQLLFVLHHLFKQSRSVRWAARVIKVRVDIESPAKILALLELLLARPRLDTAQECTEECEEIWEEVDKHGDGGAVSEGNLRERDLLALLQALPLRDLVARILLFTHNDITRALPHEWSAGSGRGVLRACYGVRALLRVLRNATSVHVRYARLQQVLRDVAARALHGLACLHCISCDNYSPELRDKVTAELQASFYEGLQLFGYQELQRLPATLLTDDAARTYCHNYIEQLHEAGMSCDMRVSIISQAAVDRVEDHELARTVLDFLLQTGLKRRPIQCKGSCETTSRQCLSQLFAAHPYLHTLAFHTLADMNMVEQLEATSVSTLHVSLWRPSAGEARAVLDDWARRCPLLLQHLLLQIDCTPYVGLELDVQLTIGNWMTSYVRATYTSGVVPEYWWAALRRLRTHRSSWVLPLDAPPPDEVPTDLFSIAYAVFSSSWGHCIPVICSEGVSALCQLAVTQPREAVHCLSCVMLVMSHSPESVSLTPKFNELFTTLLSSGPSLVARALGRGGVSGAELLLRLILAQLDNEHTNRAATVTSWLHALCGPGAAAAGLSALDVAARYVRTWQQLDYYCNLLLQDENAKERINYLIRNAYTCPLLCECVLRMCQTQYETLVHYGYGRLLNALHQQRAAGQKIHVDNALQQVSANISSDELVIYRAATAALLAPMNHPSHLTLWRLLLHLYLQRAPDHVNMPPIGPLFYSGLIKSRTLTQIKKRLQDTIAYHHNEAATLKTNKSIQKTSPQSTKSLVKSDSVVVDDSLLPALTIVDLAGESSDSSDSEDSIEDRSDKKESTSQLQEAKDILNMIAYHNAAEKMTAEYLCWLEEGDKVRALPHHADIARFIPEHALETAWKRSISRPTPSEDLDTFPLPTQRPTNNTAPPNTPFHKAVENIMKIKDRSRKRHKTTEIKSPMKELDCKDPRALLSIVDKHLDDIQRLAQEWCDDVSRISALDSKLWELVAALRVNRPIPPVYKNCPKNCKPIVFVIAQREWCLSVDAERGVQDNRRSARALVRRLARARPHHARTAAALLVVAGQARSAESGERVLQAAWRAGTAAAASCAPAAALLTACVTALAERWVCHNGRTCSQLLSTWGKSKNKLQQTLCGSLLSPRRLSAADWPLVYTALLNSNLPSHAVFSYLSKFEMHRWTEVADPTQRREILDALLQTIQRYGSRPSTEHQMLIEIVGVHSGVVVTSRDVHVYVCACTSLSRRDLLPPAHWTHVIRAVQNNKDELHFDQLGHLLREVGGMWWEVRSTATASTSLSHVAVYAPYVAGLLNALQRAFVAAAKRLSYEPERIAWYAWSSLQESWGAWISPHPGSPPLLPSTGDDEQYISMVRYFVDNVHQIILDCPGTENYLLQQIFEWCCQTYMSVHSTPSVTSPNATLPNVTSPSVTQESRVQVSALLSELAKLPWHEHQWFFGNSIQVALQTSSCPHHELSSWCCVTWRESNAATLLRDVEEQLVPRLVSLLYLFTGTLLPVSQHVLDEACKLPWHRLPELALEEALDRFFRTHHNVAQPYHDLPQFRLILVSCELSANDSQVLLTPAARHKRGACVSQWTRAASSPALLSHVPAHTTYLLNVLMQLVEPLSESEGELEELLSRALVIMCIEPAASAALPVWSRACGAWNKSCLLAALSAAATLTSLPHAAPLADVLLRAALLNTEGRISWQELSSRWVNSPWRDVNTLVLRGKLHVAYVCYVAHAALHQLAQMIDTIQALHITDIHFIDNEVIVAVWICYIARMSTSSSAELSSSARALLSRWGEQERRSLLSRVTMQVRSDKPTALHRILCRYALYILDPTDESRRTFENAYTSVFGGNSDVTTWSMSPQLSKLVTLAIRLYTKHDHYFIYEIRVSS